MSPAVPDLTERLRQPELMDEPSLDPGRHQHALDALERVNRVSLATRRVWEQVRGLSRDGVRPVRVLDVACGGGDVLRGIGRLAGRHRVDVELTGCDVSVVALERARRPVGGGAPPRFTTVDVLRGPLPGKHDLVYSSLFLHHLDRTEGARLIAAMARATEHVLLVEDLRRTRLGYVFAWVGLRVLTTSDVARTDGPISVQAAYTMDEARALAAEAGIEGAEIRACWPQRFTIRWVRK